MRTLLATFTVLTILICVCNAAPALSIKDNNKDPKSAFGPAFDEIVVESSLTVKRKTPERQGRNQNDQPIETIKTKRQTQFGGAAADSQAQAFNSFGPLGTFGASSTGTQTQAFQAGNGGFAAGAGFSGTQQYHLPNGQTVDIAFGNTFSGAPGTQGKGGAAAISVTGPDGQKRPLNG